MRELKELVRPNVWNLKPYSSARDEFHGEASVFLDANENPWNSPYNRYPDPMQWALKSRISVLKEVPLASIFLGNGSDEAIDLVIRVFCEPAKDEILSIAPSYGMYEVSAEVNNVAFRKVMLDERFQLDAEALLREVRPETKVIFLCSPNNPSGNLLDREAVCRVIESFDGIVVVDEAYIDFAGVPSFTHELPDYPNLVILQTLSKAWGAAGIRLGMAFASPEIIGLMNKMKYPYNVNQLTQEKALELLADTNRFQEQLFKVLSERERLADELGALGLKVYPSDANFLLVEVGDANGMYDYLVGRGVIVRNRNSVAKCLGCLRITVGTPDENNQLLDGIKARL